MSRLKHASTGYRTVLVGKYTNDDGERLLVSGTHQELLALRFALIDDLNRTEHEPRSGLRAQRIAELQRWLKDINQRLKVVLRDAESVASTAKPSPSSLAARAQRVAIIRDGGVSADQVAFELNQQIEAGFIVHSFQIVANDLVLLYTEPLSI